jgi:uncharacterized RDD family membrane protein YckC
MVDSASGTEVSLPLAGAGARSFAFIVDWHIRALLALTWYAAAALLYNGRLSLAPPLINSPRWFGAVVMPALMIYFLYHLVLEPALGGSTPGKRMAGVRIVSRDGTAAGVGALLVRNVFRLIDSLPVCYGLGLTLVGVTREQVRCGDMAAGTLLVYEQSATYLAVALPGATGASGLDAAGAELVAELLQRWPELAPEARAELGRRLLARCGDTAAGLAELQDDALRGRLEQLATPVTFAPA